MCLYWEWIEICASAMAFLGGVGMATYWAIWASIEMAYKGELKSETVHR